MGILIKFAEYVAGSLLCKRCKFGGENMLQFQRYKMFRKGLLFWSALYMKLYKNVNRSNVRWLFGDAFRFLPMQWYVR